MIVPTEPGRNPFSTCWIRPGACPYLCADQGQLESWSGLLEEAGGGQLVGPHGVGTSTLMASLVELLQKGGQPIQHCRLLAGQHRLPGTLQPGNLPIGCWLAIDGFEQLSAWRRRGTIKSCRRRGIRLLVTSHRAFGFGHVIQLQPGLATVGRVVDFLQRRGPQLVTASDLGGLLVSHGDDIRELLFACYDLYERRQRAAGE